jgi:choline dehydrogenase-like flavoprotein
MSTNDYKVVVIGSGFGGSMTALSLAERLKEGDAKILIVERGTWWTTPVSTVQDKEVRTYDFLVQKSQPVQLWSSQNHFRGLIDIFTRCFRRTKDASIFTRLFRRLRNEDGLIDMTQIGRRALLGLFGAKSDGVTVLRANGVGGGSLIYSNITIRPPNFIFDDPRWPLTWTPEERDRYFDLARHAIGYGVVSAIESRAANNIPYRGEKPPPHSGNAGLSNIVTRSARLDPHWRVKPDPTNPRGIKQIVINPPSGAPVPDRTNALWMDRARVFQTAMKELTTDFGAVDLSINDITPEGTALGPGEPPANYPLERSVNYCERQGRCNIGCLPGARHTLNKQLMGAVHGRPDGTPPLFKNLSLEPLSEVDVIEALPGGGYAVHFEQQSPENYKEQQEGKPRLTTTKRVTADIVIVAAGCVGSNEIVLRSKDRGTLPNLSDKTGFGFSTNGDYVAYLEKTKERVSLIRGPVTTTFAHFNTDELGTGPDGPNSSVQPDTSLFHTIEDQGIPPALATVSGYGVPLIKALSRGKQGTGFILRAIVRYGLKFLKQAYRELFTNSIKRGEFFRSEEEHVANMMCVVGIGRESAVGQFRLGKGLLDTSLRVRRSDGKAFWDDPIFDAIRTTLARLADKLRAPGTTDPFDNPFLTPVVAAFSAESIGVPHPLGGCRMARNAEEGVVDEYGRVFDKTKGGDRPFHEGLYVADAAVIPTALGVNPSLTISTLALRIADRIAEDMGY